MMSDKYDAQLINSVQNCPVLWDRTHSHFNNSAIVKKEWNRIAAGLKEPTEAVMGKWMSLREKFKKQLNDIFKHHFRDGVAVTRRQYPRSKVWCHFESMLFLKSTLMPVKMRDGKILLVDHDTCGAFSLEEDGEPSILEPFDLDIEGAEPQPNTASSEQPTKAATSASEQPQSNNKTKNNSVPASRKRKAPKQKEGRVEIELSPIDGERVTLLINNDTDDDVNFFKSLLPHVKQLPSVSKLYFRSHVQNILANELSKAHNIGQQSDPNVASGQASHPPNVPSPASTVSTCFSPPVSPVAADNNS